jgi:hypothetical protein
MSYFDWSKPVRSAEAQEMDQVVCRLMVDLLRSAEAQEMDQVVCRLMVDLLLRDDYRQRRAWGLAKLNGLYVEVRSRDGRRLKR